MKTLAALLTLALLCLTPLKAQAAPPETETAAIEHLIGFVRDSGLTFIRNGDPHTPAEAAEHMAMKYGKAKDRISTADEFIDKIASKSSMTGKAYLIRAADGTEREVGKWLREELEKYRTKKPSHQDRTG